VEKVLILLPVVLNNLLILLGLTFVFSLTLRFLAQVPHWRYVIMLGLAFGGIAVAAMGSAVAIAPGVHGDFGDVVVAGAGVFGGPWTAGVCALLASIYRFFLGGQAIEAIVGIWLAAGLGAVFHLFWIARQQPLRQWRCWALGFGLALAHGIAPGLASVALPGTAGGIQAGYPQQGIFSLAVLVYPLALVLFCQLIALELKRLQDAAALTQANKQLRDRSDQLETINQRLGYEITERQEVEGALRESEEKFRAIIEQSGEGIAIIDAQGRFRLVNPRFCELTDYAAYELDSIRIEDLLPPASESSLLHQALRDQSGIREMQLVRKDGARIHAEIGGYPITMHGEKFILGIVRDIAKRKQAEEALRQSEERFRNLIEGAVLGIVIDRDGKPLFVNRTYANIFGYDSPDDILQLESLDPLYPLAERERIRGYRKAPVRGAHAPSRYEFQGIKKDGSAIWLETQVRLINWHGERAVQSTVIDITARKQDQEKMLRQANFDEVTDLPNRLFAFNHLTRLLRTASGQAYKLGLLFIDLDQFKRVNDTLGHAVGDRILRQAGNRLQACVRQGDLVARLGGDEFTIILPRLPSAAEAEQIARRILEAFSRFFKIEGHEIFISASIGITLFPDDGDSPQTLMRNADAAMYRAKALGRNSFQFFTPALNQAVQERVKIESLLHQALAREELSLCYQPIVASRSGRVRGIEALLRWHNPELGAMPPERFVAIAEETGLIITIGEWVLRSACEQTRRWQLQYDLPLRVAVNVSGRQFWAGGVLDRVKQSLQLSGLAPEALELEITESLLVEDLPEITAELQGLDALGVRLSVDDFGAGYSSLSYLKRFPVDTLKVDKSFVQDAPDDPDDVALIEAIIALGHSLKLEVSAEGVETRQQWEFLRARGCDLMQGFYISRPLSVPDCEAFLANWATTAGRVDAG